MKSITLFMKDSVKRVKCFVFPTAIFLIISPVYAHKCILEGNTAADISRYNSCKADLNIAYIHSEAPSEITENMLDQLKVENTLLKAKLERMRRQLLSILSDF